MAESSRYVRRWLAWGAPDRRLSGDSVSNLPACTRAKSPSRSLVGSDLKFQRCCADLSRENRRAPADLPPGRFVADSPLEGDGFELSVPRHGEVTAAQRSAITAGYEARGQ